MTTKKKAAAKPATKAVTKPDGTPGSSQPDQTAQDAHAARMKTMEPDGAPQSEGQTATVSKGG